MDLGTVVGWIAIMALLLYSMQMGVGVAAYVDIPSVLIVFGGANEENLRFLRLGRKVHHF